MTRLDLTRWSEPQRQAILARGHNVLVSAGAGSGKTSVLVERVVSCLLGEQAVDVDQLLIVTFTDAAAAEMKQRIGDRLQALIAEARKCGDRESAKRLSRQYMLLGQAQISTLHSFCLDIVERNFLSLQLDPGFRLLDEHETVVLRQEIVQQLLEENLRGDNKAAFQTMLSTFGAQDPVKLVSLVLRLDTFAQSQAHPKEWLEKMASMFPVTSETSFHQLAFAPAFLAWAERLTEDAEQMLTQAQMLAVGQEELVSYAENIELMLEHLEKIRTLLSGTPKLSEVHSVLRAILSQKSPRVKGEHPDKEQVQKLRNKALDNIKLVEEVIGRGEAALVSDLHALQPAIQALASFVIAFEGRYLEAKLSSGRLDFQDLEHLAYQALEDETTGERARLQARFAEIFVDEYQDTSPIQDAIVRKIARPEGNVFVVGDVKQSIYRFRMAEPKLFLNEYARLGTNVSGEVIDLGDNYRSRREVVAGVNFVFSQLFSVGTSGFAYDERAAMRASADYPLLPTGDDSEYPIEIHLVERKANEQDKNNVNELDDVLDVENLEMKAEQGIPDDDLSAMEKEALVIALRILELMGRTPDAPRQLVWDKAQRQYRPIEYRDIVILLRSVQGRMNVLLDVFRKLDIPAFGATSTGFFESLEVKWLMALLTAIDNPRRELAFVTMLKSPLVGFDDEALARIRTAGKGNFLDAFVRVAKWRPNPTHEAVGTPNRLASSAPWQEEFLVQRVRQFWHDFRKWRALARRSSAEAVLRFIIAETGFLHYVTGMQGGLVRKGNVEALVNRARAFDALSSDGIFGFVQQAEEGLAYDVDVGEAHTASESENVVRIMTIHRSKGLEFPVVFVADIGKQFHREASEASFALHRDLGFGPTFYEASTHRRWRTMASIALLEQERSEYLSEEARVLYVAMTRARERLIFVGSAMNLNKVIAKAAFAMRSAELEMPKTSFLAAKSYLDWLTATFMRHPHCHRVWSRLLDNDKFNKQETMPLTGAPVVTIIWNREDGRKLPYHLYEQSKPAMMHGRIDDVTTLVHHLRQASVNDSVKKRVLIVEREEMMTSLPSKVSATELRRLWGAVRQKTDQRQKMFQASAEKLLDNPVFADEGNKLGQALGTAFHTIMQHLDFHTQPTSTAVQASIDALVKSGRLAEDEVAGLDIEDVLGWLRSPLGRRIADAIRVFREQPFFHRIQGTASPDCKHLSENDQNPYVIAQGVIDCLAEEADRWILVDYKTDNITADMVREKTQEYRAQVATYLAAVELLTREKPVEAYLYFVKPQVSVRVESMDLSQVFRTELTT